MTPQNQLGNSQPSPSMGNSSPLANKVMDMGNPQESQKPEQQADQNSQNNPSEKLIKRFSVLHGMFQDLASEFPGGEDEVKNVQTALGNWLNKSVKQISEANRGASNL